jgi:hypothetical protein
MANNGSVAEVMFEQMLIASGARPSPSEVRSWGRSVPVLTNDLVEAGLDRVEVMLEHTGCRSAAAGLMPFSRDVTQPTAPRPT